MKFSERFIKYWKHLLITFAISLIVGLLVTFLLPLSGNYVLYDFINSTTLAGVVLIGSGILSLLARMGAFDTFSYGFKQMGSMLFSRHEPNKYNDMASYKDDKRTKRSSSPDYYLAIMAAGILFFIATLVISIIWAVLYLPR